MKPATQGKDIIRDDHGDIIGINIGYDYAAEHEWGIGFASRYLGRQGTPTKDCLGVEARSTTMLANSFAIELVEHKGELWLRGSVNYSDRPENELKAQLKAAKSKQPYYLTSLQNPWRETPIRSAWSGDSGFIVVASSDDAKIALGFVYEALINKRCFINQATGLFGRGGLCFVPTDLVPIEYFNEMADGDLSQMKLSKLVAENGILDRLAAAGKRYYACSPRWSDETETEFSFWLNPQDQKYNRYGWVTVQDLDDWIAGTGRIPHPDNRESYAGGVS